MITGISTACFYPMATEDAIDLISSLGFKTIEFFINSEYEYSPQYIIEQKEKLDKLGITVTSVHSYSTAFEHYLLFSQYERRSREGLRIFNDILNATQLLGAKYLTFHGITTFMSMISDGECIKMYRDLINIASKYNVVIAQENVSYCRSSDPDFISLLSKEFYKDQLMFTLDIKQAKRVGVSLDSYFDAMGKRIANVHINDNDEKNVCLLPGAGKVDFNKFFTKIKSAGYSGNFIIEVYRFNFEDVSEVVKAKKNIDLLIEYFDK